MPIMEARGSDHDERPKRPQRCPELADPDRARQYWFRIGDSAFPNVYPHILLAMSFSSAPTASA